MKLTKDVLDNGGVLRSLIQLFNKKQDMNSFMMVFQCLRDSYVYVPCVLSIEGEVQNGIFDYDALDHDLEIIIKPDFLYTNDGIKYFPTFSCSELIPIEDNKDMSAIRRHFLDVIDWADFSKDVEGILVDAFTDMFVCEKSMYDTVKQMNSLVDEDIVLN